jgi:hypothetical protein
MECGTRKWKSESPQLPFLLPLVLLFLVLQCVHKCFFSRCWYFISQSLFKALFRNKNDLTDQLNKFQFGARLEPAMNKLVISDEATSHLSGRVNWHSLRIWGSENPRQSFEHERDSPKFNVFAAVSREKLYGPFIFIERTVTGIIYLDMLREWLMPQLQEGIPDIPTTLHEQDTYQRGLCKYWSGNSPQRVAGGWISVWCCLSHSWRSYWTLLMTNYCS